MTANEIIDKLQKRFIGASVDFITEEDGVKSFLFQGRGYTLVAHVYEDGTCRFVDVINHKRIKSIQL